mmetsp:Transcript_5239/g.13370  ORF Transcript_5239/g.13370 Transcript_5239/m.13370 type:complete len:219 (+) Transcript_5239:1367-2023(+)
MGIGDGPAPQRCTIAPHRCWSPKKGQTSVGLPARRLAATVPAPPWWTHAATRGKSQSCGQLPKTNTFSVLPSPSRSRMRCNSSDQSVKPLCSKILTPASRAAVTIAATSFAGEETTIEPKPTKTGGGPSRRKAASCGGGTYFGSPPSGPAKKWPTTSMCSPQSAGLGQSAGLHILTNGTWRELIKLAGLSVTLSGLSPSERRKLLMFVARATHMIASM